MRSKTRPVLAEQYPFNNADCLTLLEIYLTPRMTKAQITTRMLINSSV